MKFLRVVCLLSLLFFLGGFFTPVAFAQQTATVSLTLVVNAPAPIAITPTTLPNVVVGSTYNQKITGAGGVGPLVYSVSLGSLPPGLFLNSATGDITGTTTTAGSYPFTIKVSDSESTPETNSQAYTVVVIAKLTFTTTSIPATTINQPYSAAIAFTGGIGPFVCSVSSGSLPPGLTLALSGNSCLISGTPTTTGTTPFTVQVTSAQ